ncbi:MAG: heparan-alpha-glucosaminide N-acetyltransferase [Anaerolineae bacterium]
MDATEASWHGPENPAIRKTQATGLRILRRLGSFLLLHTGSTGRYWEVDALRGLAVVMMVIYHLTFDLVLLGYWQISLYGSPWQSSSVAIAGLFILVAGASLILNRARVTRRASEQGAASARDARLFRRTLVRGLKLLGWGMLISLAAWVYMGKMVIVFGILHFVGTATILAYPFLGLHWANLVLGAVIITVSRWLSHLPVQHPALLILGVGAITTAQLDYLPLFPWFGVMLLGVFFGQVLYPDGVRRLVLPDLGARQGIRQLVWVGRHSLLVYLVHQPVLLAFLTLAKFVGLGPGAG